MDLYGLSLLLDEHLFGDKAQFRKYGNQDGNTTELKHRLKNFVHRTLRKNVLEYIKYTKRQTITQTFCPTDTEQQLYEAVSAFLQRPYSYALPKQQRQLMGLVLCKLLASSPSAIAGTLSAIKERLLILQDDLQNRRTTTVQLKEQIDELLGDSFGSEDYDAWQEDEPCSDESPDNKKPHALEQEIQEIDGFITLAINLTTDSKADALLIALRTGFDKMAQLGAAQKAIIFTESTRTQAYMYDFLSKNGYDGELVNFNGTNTHAHASAIYETWKRTHAGSDRLTGSPDVDRRTALIDYFRTHAKIMIATEAGAEGVNLQFCSLIVNYDLPWNPQGVEQRIGRCHRYGQKFDVVVINLLNQRNKADQRVLELLTQKFQLFDDVFGASDEVLGRIESGVDFEKRILEIYNQCRNEEQIEQAFDTLQTELEDEISSTLAQTQDKLFDHFDEEVRERLKIRLDDTTVRLDKMQRWFWALTQFSLHPWATFDHENYTFYLRESPHQGILSGAYRLLLKTAHTQDDTYHEYRLNSALGDWCVHQALAQELSTAELRFDYQARIGKLSALDAHQGQSGWLRLDKITHTTKTQTEQTLVFIACTDHGQWLDDELCAKLFDLPASVHSCDVSAPTDIEECTAFRLNAEKERISSQYTEWHRQELDRVDGYLEDLRRAMNAQIESVKEEKKALNNLARQAKTLEELHKIKGEEYKKDRRIRTLRRERDDKEDELEVMRDDLMDDLRDKINVTTTTQTLFVVRWQITQLVKHKPKTV